MSRCRACPARVVWARTDSGKLLPLDATEDGALRTYASDESSANVAVHTVAGRRVARVLKADEGPLGDEVRAMPHFATCPGWTR